MARIFFQLNFNRLNILKSENGNLFEKIKLFKESKVKIVKLILTFEEMYRGSHISEKLSWRASNGSNFRFKKDSL